MPRRLFKLLVNFFTFIFQKYLNAKIAQINSLDNRTNEIRFDIDNTFMRVYLYLKTKCHFNTATLNQRI